MLYSDILAKVLKVYSFKDERLSDYLIITKNGVYDGKIILKSNLNNILAKINEEIKKQKELKRLQKKMKEYRKPLEMELLKIKNRNPELSESILNYITKLNRTENPKQLMGVINEIRNWLKRYSIILSEEIIEELTNNIKTEQANNNGKWWRLLLR